MSESDAPSRDTPIPGAGDPYIAPPVPTAAAVDSKIAGRKFAAFTIMLGGGLLGVGSVGLALWALSDLTLSELSEANITALAWFLGARSVVTIASLGVGFKLIQAGRRMLWPYQIVADLEIKLATAKAMRRGPGKALIEAPTDLVAKVTDALAKPSKKN